MRAFALILAGVAFAFGLAAAWVWLLASRIDAAPVWGEREPLNPRASQAGWIAGLLTAAGESARLNRRAAALTAVAVLASTASSVAGLFV